MISSLNLNLLGIVDKDKPIETIIQQAWRVLIERKALIWTQHSCHSSRKNKTAGHRVKEFFCKLTKWCWATSSLQPYILNSEVNTKKLKRDNLKNQANLEWFQLGQRNFLKNFRIRDRSQMLTAWFKTKKKLVQQIWQSKEMPPQILRVNLCPTLLESADLMQLLIDRGIQIVYAFSNKKLIDQLVRQILISKPSSDQ